MKIHNRAFVRGNVEIRVFRVRNGERTLIHEESEHNLIVDNGLETIIRALSSPYENCGVTQVAFGSNGEDPQPSDGSITEAYVKNLFATKISEDGKSVTYEFILDISEDNGNTIQEFGLFFDAQGLFARRTLMYPIEKNSDIAIEGVWTISIETEALEPSGGSGGFN